MWLFLITFNEVLKKAASPITFTHFRFMYFKKYEHSKADSPTISSLSPTNFSIIDWFKQKPSIFWSFTATNNLMVLILCFSILHVYYLFILKNLESYDYNIKQLGIINTSKLSPRFSETLPCESYKM